MSVQILVGCVFERLAQLPDESVHCVVTSPPYWGLRDYGVDGQIGMEPTLAEHIDVIVKVMREVRRVLRKDGTVWFNYGDCYATQPNGRSAADTKAAGNDDRTFRDKPFSTVQGTLKPKDLCMVANRIAIALQDDGWWVRSEIIWVKPNPMPESISDRPASSHEKIFLLTKSARYFYDAEAVREDAQPSSIARWNQNIEDQNGSERANGATRTDRPMKAVGGPRKRGSTPRHNGHIEHTTLDGYPRGAGRNLRNVWTVATKPFSEAHFATFPPDLIEPCIKAGTSQKGVCPECGAPWTRIKGERVDIEGRGSGNKERKFGCDNVPGASHVGRGFPWKPSVTATAGWEPSCECNFEPVPATVLDPFGGAGTTALVADRLQRQSILIELNPEYAELARRRISGDAGLFSSLVPGDEAAE